MYMYMFTFEAKFNSAELESSSAYLLQHTYIKEEDIIPDFNAVCEIMSVFSIHVLGMKKYGYT